MRTIHAVSIPRTAKSLDSLLNNLSYLNIIRIDETLDEHTKDNNTCSSKQRIPKYSPPSTFRLRRCIIVLGQVPHVGVVLRASRGSGIQWLLDISKQRPSLVDDNSRR